MNVHTQIGAVDATLSHLLDGGTLADALPRVAARIRQEPKNAAHRLLYFDLLCLTGAWEKALPVLQMAVDMDAGLTPVAYVCRQLVQAELFRAAVFAGQHQPAFSLTVEESEAASSTPQPPLSPLSALSWLPDLWQALCAQHSGDLATADRLRNAALAQCPDTVGHMECLDASGHMPAHLPTSTATRAFTWLADSDSRLGPVLEVFAGGRYVWLPFCHVRSLTLHGPRSLQDLLWLPATLTTHAHPAEEFPCFVPGRYVGSERHGDALALGRETRWENVGETGVVALGQKTLMSDAGDVPLYDVRSILIDGSPERAL